MRIMNDLRFSILRFLEEAGTQVDFATLSRGTNTGQHELAAELVILVEDRKDIRIIEKDGDQFFEITEKGTEELDELKNES